MPKPYSDDLRERVIEAVVAGASRREAAESFSLSESVDILVMLVQHHPVESELVGIDELLDIFLIEVTGAIAIPQVFGTVTHPLS
jgi:hypothetical protein